MADIIQSYGLIKTIDTGTLFKIEYNGTVRLIINKTNGQMTLGSADGTGSLDLYSGGVRAVNYVFVNDGGSSPSARFYSKNAQGQEVYQDDSAGLHIVGTKSYVKFPNMTSTQRDALTGSAGMVVYNTTTSKLQVYSGGVWVDLH